MPDSLFIPAQTLVAYLVAKIAPMAKAAEVLPTLPVTPIISGLNFNSCNLAKNLRYLKTKLTINLITNFIFLLILPSLKRQFDQPGN